MKYLLSVIVEHGHPVPAGGLDIESWVERHDATGAREFGDRLADANEAVTLRIREDGTHVDAGPYTPSHPLAGIDILEAENMDAAIAIALEHPMAREGAIELRPFFDWDGDGA